VLLIRECDSSNNGSVWLVRVWWVVVVAGAMGSSGVVVVVVDTSGAGHQGMDCLGVVRDREILASVCVLDRP
jgi:hypothetical protein